MNMNDIILLSFLNLKQSVVPKNMQSSFALDLGVAGDLLVQIESILTKLLTNKKAALSLKHLVQLSVKYIKLLLSTQTLSILALLDLQILLASLLQLQYKLD